MFTKWYKYVCKARLLATTVSGLKALDGTTFTTYGSSTAGRIISELALGYALDQTPCASAAIKNGGSAIWFGSGTKEPTEDDYKLESELSGVTVTKGTRTTSESDGQLIVGNTFMITNNNKTEITVSEVGIYAGVISNQSSTYTYKYALLERSVFEPVTIPAGESATVKYEIVFKYPID